MDDQYEQCRQNLVSLAKWYRENIGDRNEATTRLHLINGLFLDCLGWTNSDVEAEEHESGERTDYVFSAPRRVLIVEAKREGKYFELPVGQSDKIEFAIAGLCKDYPDLKEAITQVANYCQHRGAPFGAVCNGHQIVAFVASREDGESPFDGKAIVFESLEQMSMHFIELWNVLSKPAVEEKKLRVRLVGDRIVRLPPKLSKGIGDYPGVKRRNVFQVDLKILSELVLEDVTKAPELEARFLRDCYCQSGALSQNSKLAKEVLRARYAGVLKGTSDEPVLDSATMKKGINPNLLADSVSRRPVLLVGDVGVGKSIFMRNLIKVEARNLLKNHIVLNVDLGSQAALAMDLKTAILNIIEGQLLDDYGIDIYQGKFVRNVYRNEMLRFKKGIYEELAKTDPSAFKGKEVAFLEKKIQGRDQHIRKSIESIRADRGMEVLFVLDNVDQRTDERVQEQAFLIAQEIAGNWEAMVFVALRPETFHRSLRRGSISGYHPKAFSIAPPRIDRVLQKRLEFANLVTTGKIPITHLTSASIKLEALNVIITSFLQSMQRSNELVDFLDNITGGNVRLALDLVRDFFGSGHVDTHKIIEIYKGEKRYFIPLHEFLRSVIYGEAEYYDPTKSCIANVFDISTRDPKEHFLVPIMVEFVNSDAREHDTHGFTELSRVYDRLQELGFSAEQIDRAVVKSCRDKLLESASRTIPYEEESAGKLLRATSVGLYHVEELPSMFSYVDAIVVDTPILEKEPREGLHNVDSIDDRLERAKIFRKYLDGQWESFEDRSTEFDWVRISKRLQENIAHVQKVIRWR